MKRVRINAQLLLCGALACEGGCSKPNGKLRPSSAASANSTHAATASSVGPAQRSRYQFSSGGDSSLQLRLGQGSAERAAQFTQFSGSVEVLELDARSLSLDFEISANSLESADPQLASDAKSHAGLNSDRFPTAHFGSTSVLLGGALGATNTIQGELRLCELTRPIALPATIHIRSHDIDIDGEFPIDPGQFGCAPAVAARKALAAPWRVLLSIHAER